MPLFGLICRLLEVYTRRPCRESLWHGNISDVYVQPIAVVCSAVPAGKADFQSEKVLTKNANQWAARELTEEEVRTFRRVLRQSGLRYPTAHDPYLIDLASPDEALYRRSLEAFVVEVQRAEQLGLRYLVTHPARTSTAVRRRVLPKWQRRWMRYTPVVHVSRPDPAGDDGGTGELPRPSVRAPGPHPPAGPRSESARRLSRYLPRLRRGLWPASGGGVPSHVPRLRSADRLEAAAALPCQRQPQAARQPRGPPCAHRPRRGRLEAFRLLLNDPRFRTRPMILETPKEDGGTPTWTRSTWPTCRADGGEVSFRPSLLLFQ